MLPTFLIIGAQKAGTTSLHHQLTEHPSVGAPFKKEPGYFSHHWDRSTEWYRSLFPLVSEAADVERRTGTPMQVGEATPFYLSHPKAAERARSVVPDAKLVAILRNPVERAISHHNHERAYGFESLELEEALDREEERLAGDTPRLGRLGHFGYVARGRYAVQLERWLEFYAREQLLVVISEEFYADPVGETMRVQEFLGLPPRPPTDVEPRNARQYDGAEAAIRRRLAACFVEDNERLARLLGRDLPWD